MAFLKFNKAELVNLPYSLKREIICANKTGAYCNTSIVTCNTRRYHGLLAVPIDAFGGQKHLLLSSLDETLILNGKSFNLGIHRYGDIYEPRGHKYIIDFEADPVPKLTYRVGEMILIKSILLVPDNDQVMVRFELLDAPGDVTLSLKPFLAFRDIHSLTNENPGAVTGGWSVSNGMAFNLYEGFPDLNLQLNTKQFTFLDEPCWYKNVTYSDEARRGFPCQEDLFVPGSFEVALKPGDSVVFSASVSEVNPAGLKRRFSSIVATTPPITSFHDQLKHCANLLKQDRHGHKMISAGFSWMYTGLLRETLASLAGLTLYANGSRSEFEEILDNLIEDNQQRLFNRTTQVEAPLRLALALQHYIHFGASAKAVWKKYGRTLMDILESYLPCRREEVAMHPNGLLWAQLDLWALTWMNAYIDGRPVTERAGYQVETNALWYNSICFAVEMESRFGDPDGVFVAKFTSIAKLVRKNFKELFYNQEKGYLADYVDNCGQHLEVRPNMLFALWGDYPVVDDEIARSVLNVVEKELVTRRGVRSLSPRNPDYKGVYEGTQHERDLAYHNGTNWTALLEPYVEISFKFKGKSFLKKAQWLTEGFFEDLNKHGVGAFSELYDGDPPYEPHGAISSAMSTASLLAVDYHIEKNKERER